MAISSKVQLIRCSILKSMEVSKIIVPQACGVNAGRIVSMNGQVVKFRLGKATKLYIFHDDPEEDGTVRAFEITVKNPLTRARAIDAAEREAYHLRTADDVASFNASLARKFREAYSRGETDAEVIEHDNFIADVKQELSRIGIDK